MFDFFKKLVGQPCSQKSFLSPMHGEEATNAHLEVYCGDDAGELALTRYPPFDQGIPLIEVDTLLHSQEELITRIFRTAGVSREEFDLRYQPAIRNLALHVHLLPATSTTYFRGTGGLFRMSLEVALNALQTANASVFPIAGGIERRFYIQPKWSLAVFLAGLCSQLYRTFNSMVVISRDNQQWTSLLDHLYDWAQASNIDRYHVRWLEDAPIHGAQSSGSSGMNHIVPREVLQYLASDNNQVFPAMTAAISGVDYAASENPIARIIAPIITRVIQEDLKRTATNYGHLVIGAHLEPHLLDAMRRLVRGGKWIPNQPDGRLWVGKEGVFIDWIAAASDIALLMEKDAFAGVPKDPETLAEILANAGMLEMTKKDERYWTITLPVTLEMRDTVVKLGHGISIFPDQFDLKPFENIQLTLAPPPVARKPKEQPISEHKTAPRLEEAVSRKEKPAEETQPALPIEPPVEDRPESVPSSYAIEQEPAPFDGQDYSQRTIGAEAVPEQGVSNGESRKRAKKPVIAQSEGDSKPEQAPSASVKKKANTAISEETSSRLLDSLSAENAAALRTIIAKARADENSGVAVTLPFGVGLSHRALVAAELPVSEMLQELAMKQWLWIDKTKPTKKIHSIEVDGESITVMVLKSEIAGGLGLCQG